ncbi:uncharacterized protein [Clytia hemisphaerica]|uniref:uncharacterized protein n=1 Tax=Clytia hemisphaerica TaxID=252671 RepID=UPI0034D57472
MISEAIDQFYTIQSTTVPSSSSSIFIKIASDSLTESSTVTSQILSQSRSLTPSASPSSSYQTSMSSTTIIITSASESPNSQEESSTQTPYISKMMSSMKPTRTSATPVPETEPNVIIPSSSSVQQQASSSVQGPKTGRQGSNNAVKTNISIKILITMLIVFVAVLF